MLTFMAGVTAGPLVLSVGLRAWLPEVHAENKSLASNATVLNQVVPKCLA
jgi:hypothetical protein